MAFVRWFEAVAITEVLWCCWTFRSLALDPLWRRVGLEGDDVE